MSNTNSIANPLRDRYPGSRSFEQHEQQLFHGREAEIKGLFKLVKVEKLVVLFSKSGMGKTSLLNAGLKPLLEAENLYPITVRVQDTDVSPLHTTFDALQNDIDEQKLQRLGVPNTDNRTTHTLWEHLKACNFTQNGEPAIPVLIFDQFEELFNHTLPNRVAFAEQLADILSERLSENLHEELRKIPRRERTPEILEWYSPMKVRVIFAIRSSRLSRLHELSKDLPSVLKNRFQLKALNRKQARDAIIKPAQLQGEQFRTDPFRYAPSTVEMILDNLSNREEEIESFQLQILCQHIENEVLQKQKVTDNFVVTPDYLGGEKGIQDILNNYYVHQIEALGTEAEQLAARKLIEEGLIVDGARVGVAEAVVQRTYGIDNELLYRLIGSRLIRGQNTPLGKVYELSHDTLIPPILTSYTDRRIKEERIENEKKLQVAQRRQKRTLAIAIAGFTLSLIAIAALLFGLWEREKAQKEAKSAKSNYLSSQAINFQKQDPAKSFLLASYAWKYDTTKLAFSALNNAFYSNVYELNGKYYASPLYKELSWQSAGIKDIDFSPNGEYILTIAEDSIKIWNWKGEQLAALLLQPKNDNPIDRSPSEVQFSPNGKLLLINIWENDLRIWHWEKNQVDTLVGHKKPTIAAHFSPDNQYVISPSLDSFVKVWQLPIPTFLHDTIALPQSDTTDERSSLLSNVQQWVNAALPKNDSTPLLPTDSLSKDSIDTAPPPHHHRIEPILEFSDPTGLAVAAQIAPNAEYMLTISDQFIFHIWDKQAEIQHRITEVDSTHFSPDGKYAGIYSLNYSILWDSQDNKVIHLENKVKAIHFSPNSQFIALQFDDEQLHFQIIPELQTEGTVKGTFADFSPNEEYVITISGTVVDFWKINSKKMMQLTGHTDSLLLARFLPDGEHLATASADKTARLWYWKSNEIEIFDKNTATQLFQEYNKKDWEITAKMPEPDLNIQQRRNLRNRHLLRRSIRTYNTFDEEKIYTAYISPMRKFIVVVGNKTAGVWKLPQKESDLIDNLTHFTTEKGQEEKIKPLSEQERNWTLPSTKPSFKLEGHSQKINHATFSNNGRYILTASDDQTAKVWDLKGNCLMSLKAYPKKVKAAFFSPDDQYVITRFEDGKAQKWLIAPDQITAKVDSMDISDLSADEKIKYEISEKEINKKPSWFYRFGSKISQWRQQLRASSTAKKGK